MNGAIAVPGIFIDPPSGPQRRELLYAGNLVVLTDVAAVTELVAFTRGGLASAFAPHDPTQAHTRCSDHELESILSNWKADFAQRAETSALTTEVIRQAGFDSALTYFDPPKARSAFPLGRIDSGVAQQFPWHRDVWYAAPAQQVNWWLPVFELSAENSLSFDLSSFARRVDNDSATFDYEREMKKPRLAQTTTATVAGLALPSARAWEAPVETVLVPSPGQVILFSGAQLHRSVPNTSERARYSLDFRTLNRDDVLAGIGAPLVDAECTGTALGGYRRVADGSSLPEAVIRAAGSRQAPATRSGKSAR
jgi:hypothetical protein